MTLTSRPGTDVPTMMASWNRFRGWLRRRVPGVEYAAVKEFGDKRGMLHLHICLINWKYVTQREISDAWRRASRGAFIVDIRALDSGDPEDVAAYVSKYVAKAIGRRDVRKAVTYSRNWPREETVTQWQYAGENVSGSVIPNGHEITRSGLVVLRNRGCEHMTEARTWGVTEHLYFRALTRRVGDQPRE